jgi:hypothetical protein
VSKTILLGYSGHSAVSFVPAKAVIKGCHTGVKRFVKPVCFVQFRSWYFSEHEQKEYSIDFEFFWTIKANSTLGCISSQINIFVKKNIDF